MAPNPAAAYRLYYRAAEKGEPRAMNDVGAQLLSGSGVDANPVEGAKWLQRAAERGQPNAMHTLGSLYAKGVGVPKDFSRAYFWLILALKHYPPKDPHRSGAATMAGIVAMALPKPEIARIDKQIASWEPLPADAPI